MTRNYAKEYQKTLETQVRMAPMLFQAEQEAQPLYNSLSLEGLDQFLNGTKAQDYTTYNWQAPVYKVNGKRRGGGLSAVPGMGVGDGMGPMDFMNPLSDSFGGMPGEDMLGGLFGGGGGGKKLISKGQYVASGTGHRDAQRGFLDIQEHDIMPALARMLSTQREGDISDVARLGPEARAAIRSANPEQARLLDLIMGDATQGMEMGATMDPSLRREVAQATRSGQAARGMGKGPIDLFTEAMQTGSAAEALRNSRRAAATNAVGLDQQVYGDLFNRILARNGAGSAQSLTGQAAGISAAGMGAKLFNPESQYANGVYDGNMNSRQSAANNAASNNAALISGLMSMAGSAAGAAA